MGLLSILIFELNQMNSDKIMDGRVGFAVKLFIHFTIRSWQKGGNLERMSLLVFLIMKLEILTQLFTYQK